MTEWTARQREAIYEHGDESLLVSAAAGSGKTTVLVERIKELILKDDPDASLDRMLIVTFTKAAAAEMKEKLRKKLGKDLKDCKDEKLAKRIKQQLSLIGRAEICTFDSFALGIVRKYYYVVGADPGAKICDEYKSKLLKKEAMDELFSDLYEKKDASFTDFLDRYSGARSDKSARELIDELYTYTDTLADPDNFLSGALFSPDAVFSLACSEVSEEISRGIRYSEKLNELFDRNGLKTLVSKMQKIIDGLDTIKQCFDRELYEQGFTLLTEFKFETLRAAKDEQPVYDGIKNISEEYWTKGVKKVVAGLKSKYSGFSLALLKEEADKLKGPVQELCFLVSEYGRRYSEKKKKQSLMDFSDGEHVALEILKNGDVRKECREKYRYIFVDEYQDSNYLQEALIESVSSGNNLFTVGDVKQSIYRFRHAEPGLFLGRYKLYKADQKAGRNIDLNSNFRSKAPIIDFVNRLFRDLMTESSCGMSYDDEAALYEGRKYDGELLYEPALYLLDTRKDEQDEGDENSDEIEELKNDELEAMMAVEIINSYKGLPFFDPDSGAVKALEYRDMAVLVKQNSKAELLYTALTAAGIPVYLERNEGYFDTPEIQIAVNLLRIIDNFRQDIALISVLYFPLFGFSAAELASIRIDGRGCGKKHPGFSDAFMYEASSCSGELSEKCSAFLEKIKAWKIKSQALPLADFLWELLLESGIMIFAGSLSSGEQRIANLRALVDKAEEFESSDSGGVFGFVSYIDMISGKKSPVNTGQSGMVSEGENVVRIMTVHKSKGLEFPFVLFAYTGGKIKAGRNASAAVYHKEYGISMTLADPDRFIKCKPASYELIKARKEKEELAEEIRLLYVAATRAKDFFVMSAAVKDPQTVIEKKDVYSIKAASCGSFAEMALPAFSNIVQRARGSYDTSAFETAAENEAAFRKSLREGFEIDGSKMSMSAEDIEERLSFDYAPPSEQSEKRKYSVSELAKKEREKEGMVFADQERVFPVPAFLSGKVKLSAAAVGTAYHTVMERIPFTKEGKTKEEIASFVSALEEKGILTEDEADAVRPERIAEFFSSDIGKAVCEADTVKKETPFVLKHDMDGRTVYVQGTVDCWFEKDGKLFLLDYKNSYVDTDRKEEEFKRLEEEYRPQLVLYKEALEKIRGKKVEGAWLYLFGAGQLVPIGDKDGRISEGIE